MRLSGPSQEFAEKRLQRATQLQPLRSLKTATKKWKALKKKAAKNSEFAKSNTTASG
jgi:hypothetical protein